MANEDKSTSVATKKGTAVAGAYDYGSDAGVGFEGTDSSELSIPFLNVLQSNSPQVDKEDGNYVEGAEPGMLYNSVTRELFPGDGSLVFQPVHRDHLFIEWVPLKAGGGFVGIHAPESDLVQKVTNGGKVFGKIELENGNELVETYYVYGLILNGTGENTIGFAVMSFTATKIKPYRDWFTAMYTLKGKPPLFANRARLRTVRQENDKGKFYNFRIEPLGATWVDSLINPSTDAGKSLLEEARKFHAMVTSGEARAAFETERSVGDAGDGETPPF